MPREQEQVTERQRIRRTLTGRQERALRLLAQQLGGEGAVSTEATRRIDGQPWIHWRTARSLEERGLVHVDDSSLVLTAEGWAVLHDATK